MASSSHYKDWPNTQGFDVSYQELEPTELEIVGTIPAYCAGVLFRNGLGPREIQTSTGGTFKVSHWFDSLSQVHRFQIHSPTPDHPHVRVTHNSRLTCDGVIRRIQRTGYRGEITFGAKYDPCMTLFQKAQAFFAPNPKDSADGANVNVTLSVNYPGLARTGAKDNKPAEKPGIRTLCNKTDNSLMQMLDPTTLEPIGLAEQSVLHPQLKGQLSASHAKTDPVTGDVFNYNLEMGPNATYRIFMVSPSSGKTHILATIKYPAAYIHSFFLTENYVILCVWSSHFRKGGLSMLFNHNFVDTMANYTTSTPAKWFVVDRKPGGAGLVTTYECDAFFAFHSINAYEEMSTTNPSKIDIVADLCAYDSLDILKRFYMKNLMSDSPDADQSSGWSHAKSQADFRRYRLGSLSKSSNAEKPKATMEFSGGEGMSLSPELPTINPRFKCKKHRFVYGVTASGKSSFLDGLVKFDVTTKTSVHWSEHAQTPGEMIFIPDPNNQDEDAGTLLSVILDGIAGKSYLLALDAKNMTEIGRANVNSVVGFGFHGVHVPEINF